MREHANRATVTTGRSEENTLITVKNIKKALCDILSYAD